MAQRDDDRDSVRTLRARSDRQLERLEDPDLDEVSEALIEEIRAVRQLSQPDAQEAGGRPWHQKPAAKVGGVVALLSALGAVLEALRQLGVLK